MITEETHQRVEALFGPMEPEAAEDLIQTLQDDGWSLDQEESAHQFVQSELGGVDVVGAPSFEMPDSVEALLVEAAAGSLDEVLSSPEDDTSIRPEDFMANEEGAESEADQSPAQDPGLEVLQSIWRSESQAAKPDAEDTQGEPGGTGLDLADEDLPDEIDNP